MPSTRKNPARVLQSPLTGRIYAVTAYTISEDGSNLVARTKHDVTEDVQALIRQTVATNEALNCLCGNLGTGDCSCGAKVRREYLARTP